MKKLVLPIMVFILGLVIAHYFFEVDVTELFEGFGNFIVNILKGGNK